MFKKILIANRGEIACRVIKSARKMGIKTVAVYSDADEAALHVEMADEAVHLGPPPAAQSYLLADKIIQACKDTGAQAVHPGYGFLSERESFAKALDEAGIAFIGPPAKAIAAMGDKIESKKLANESGVSTVPGYIGEIEDAKEALKIAEDIGFPVMIKASAGGGGKGMRIANDATEVMENFDSARNEAIASFGDGRIFIEKFVVEPRHIEIQLIGDKHGNIVYLNERECSIQRRHQKVVEEAPSPFVDPDMRKAMGEQSVALAQAVGYYSAGTVEFVVGADKSFYFLEMNTRLQVEHPVTELITGVDLVENMIRVAAGEKLPFTQDDIGINGWAIENRVYAEDPYRNFLPSIGRLSGYLSPEESGGVRVDTGVVEGSEISMFYDPMIAKLCTWAPTRIEAIDKQIDALNDYYVRGCGHNIDFVSAVMQHERFRDGRLTTAFIAEEYPDGFAGAPLTDTLKLKFVAVAAVCDAIKTARAARISGQMNGSGPQLASARSVTAGDSTHDVTVIGEGDDWVVAIDGKDVKVSDSWRPGDVRFQGSVDGAPITIEIDATPTGFHLSANGSKTVVSVLAPHVSALSQHMIEKEAPDTSNMLLCPMPGLVVRIDVQEGEEVEVGQALAVVEAMKMENILRAERKAKVSKILANAGDSLAVDAVIMEFE
ncbi:MAG: acetyl/propionyl/methylcrotonyl-CoA carboxylase subunit alpha [Pseudomonadota bacterium]